MIRKSKRPERPQSLQKRIEKSRHKRNLVERPDAELERMDAEEDGPSREDVWPTVEESE